MSSLRGRQPRLQTQATGIDYRNRDSVVYLRAARLKADALIARRAAQRARNYAVLDDCLARARARQRTREVAA